MTHLNLFGYTVPMYGVMLVIGAAVALLTAFMLSKHRSLPGYDIIYSAVYIGIGAFTGSKLLFLIVSLNYIIENHIGLINLIKGGYVFYGGLIGGFLGLLIYVKEFKAELGDYADIFAVVIPLGHAFGRIGCFFSGCCYGIEYNGLFGYTYRQAVNANTPIGVSVFPVQLFEALLLVLLFILLLIIFILTEKRYVVILSYCIFYSVIRFLVEFLRGDPERGCFLGLFTSQWISLFMFITAISAAVILIIKQCRRRFGDLNEGEIYVDN